MHKYSSVFSCLIDASKTFDRVSFVKLFEFLIKRGLPFIVIRSVMDMYLRQRIKTEWHGAFSEYFTLTNGTKQGQILSTLLYNCYMDELISKLKKDGVGCHIGNEFVG